MKGATRRKGLCASWLALAALFSSGCTTSFELRARPADAATDHDGVDALGVDAMGIDVVGVDAMGVDAMGVDAMGVDAMGVDAVGVDAMGVDAVGVDAVADVADVRDARGTDAGCSAACPSVSDRSLHITASACVAGACRITCEASWGDCNRRASDGCEVSLTTVSNCGTCGLECIAVGSSTGCCLRPTGYRCCRTRIGVGNVCSANAPSTNCD